MRQAFVDVCPADRPSPNSHQIRLDKPFPVAASFNGLFDKTRLRGLAGFFANDGTSAAGAEN
jgi:hypothetical protein